MRQSKPLNILITFDISSIAGRDQLAGVFRFLREKPAWIPRLISRPQDFTPDIVRNAKSEQIDGIIINHAGTAETEEALARSDIPLAVIGIRNPKLVARTANVALVRNDNVATGAMAAKYFLSLGNFRSFGYIPSAPATAEWSQSREEGFRCELRKRNLDLSIFRHNATAGTAEARQALADTMRLLKSDGDAIGRIVDCLM